MRIADKTDKASPMVIDRHKTRNDMEKEKKATVNITIDPEVTEVIVVKDGQVFRAKTSDGRGACRDCELSKGGRTCVWSMVCSNVTNGARFKRYKTSADRKAEKEAEEARAKSMMQSYEKRGWNGD